MEQVLASMLPAEDVKPQSLHQAMRYAVLGGGKRVRAALVYAAGEAVLQGAAPTAAQEKALDLAAASVELIHAYSLVHDDLPCMDDDTLRRGRPTVHVQFDEATAMLAGDALQPLAFELLASMPVAPALTVQAVTLLAKAAGSLGMAGGQAIDCESVGVALSLEQLQEMHRLKTGAMLKTSILLGGIVAGASSTQRQMLNDYGNAMGLGFQVMDDILDVTADTQTLGKTAGKDAEDNKPTYVSVMGLEEAKAFLASLHEQSRMAIRALGNGGQYLSYMADYIVGRAY
ncbi:polyprenyl synthetase family protein [Alcaligenaceae bacterium 429]|nr:polyprenyl synthetase family protein [Alcaligenaceae bacterium 429]